MTKSIMSPSPSPDVTVKDLVLMAARMGVRPSNALPPAWATETIIEDDEPNFSISHRHEFGSGEVTISLENLISGKINYGDDASLWWNSTDVKGVTEVRTFTVDITDIPAIITALQAAHDVATATPRQLRRSADVEETLREREY